MNKKKVGALAAAGLMTVGVVGGTLAWFTSWDSVTNVFETGKVTDPNGNGVEIYEKFEPQEDVVPGDITTKLVQVKNTTSYDSFIRVKFDKIWTNPENNNLSKDMIELNFTENVVKYDGTKYVKVKDGTEVADNDLKGKWIQHGDGDDSYYYYVGRVPGGEFTHTLLDTVTLSTGADNEYRDAKFNVIVNAESVQADNGAYEDVITNLDNNNEDDKRILALLAKYSPKEDTTLDAGYDQADGVTPTDAIGSVRD